MTCYTDGSGTDLGRGVGLIITMNKNNTIIYKNSYKIPDNCTVFQAELTAIKVTCEYLYDHSNKHIIIWTDNLSSIQAVTALNIKSRTIRDCYDALNKLGNSNTVELRWIAAHADLWGNEQADELAKLGTTSNSILKCPIPYSYIKKKIYEKVSKLNLEDWINNTPQHTKMLLGNRPNNMIKNLNTSLINNRTNYRTAVHLITGHCALNKHLHNMGKSDTGACPKCGHDEETVSHFLGQCPATAQLRGKFFRDYYLSVNDIMDHYHITSVVNYTNYTRRLIEQEDLDHSGVT